MAIACYLAMTAAEFSACDNLPAHVGWLACHFSPSGPGLSNIPKNLPPHSLLIIDDSTPFHNHDQKLILRQLQDAISPLGVCAVMLDFQRPNTYGIQELVSLLQQELSCPVAAPPQYASENSPIFLPPCPLNLPLEKHLAPYQGREIWLDSAPLPVQIAVTDKSSTYETLPLTTPNDIHYWESALCCNYHIDVQKDRIIFTLSRDSGAMEKWLEKAEALGVTAAVGLYQEWTK